MKGIPRPLSLAAILLLPTGAAAQVSEVPDLLDDLGQRNYRLRMEAKKRLVEIGKPAYPKLVEAVRKKEAALAIGAAEILTLIDAPRVQVGDLFVSLIVDPQRPAQLRSGLIAPLARTMEQEAKVRKMVMTRIRVGKADGLEILVHAFGAVGARDRKVAPELKAILKHPDQKLALAAIRVLRPLVRFPDSTTFLATALDDDRAPVVTAAVEGLRELNGQDLSERVEAVAKIDDPGLKKVCADYLAYMKLRREALTTGLLICDYNQNRVFQLDKSGREVFAIEKIYGIWDAEKLANGNLLVTEFSASQVQEIDPKNDNKVVWSYDKLQNPYDADRLPNGNTLIADTFKKRVIEVDKKGEIVWKFDKNVHPYDADRLPNGNTLIADANNDRVIEVDKKGDIVWKLLKVPNVHDADRLPNGNTLVTIRTLNEVREVDKDGKTVARLKNLSSPSDADRLGNGCTMVAESGFVRVFSPSGKPVVKIKTPWAVEANVLGLGR